MTTNNQVELKSAKIDAKNRSKSKKTATATTDKTVSSSVIKTRKELKQLKQERRAKKPNFELSAKAKTIWEKLRNRKLTLEQKNDLANQLYALVEGKVKQLIFAHDTVRVFQCLMALKNPDIRTKLFNELKDDLVPMAKSKYSKFFVLKMLKYGTPAQKAQIMSSFSGHIVEMMKHTAACVVLQYAYNEYANAQQRTKMSAEFLGHTLQLSEVETATSMADLIKANNDKKALLMKNFCANIIYISAKSAAQCSFFHHLCWNFFENCDDINMKLETAACLKDRIPEMLHTREGALASMHCIWLCSVKDRKAIVKSLKTLVRKVCFEEYGHLVLLAIFDSVDDTVLVSSVILKEIRENLADILANKYGVRVLLYLLNNRDAHYFNTKQAEMLAHGDSNLISKKPMETRRSELLSNISQSLIDFAAEHAKEMILESQNCPFLFNMICQYAIGEKSTLHQAVCDILREEFIPANMENLHLIEHNRGHFVLKQLIKNDKTLSSIIVDELNQDVLGSWLTCNKGTFILLHMFENGDEKVKKAVKNCVLKNKKRLEKYSFKSAQILIDKCEKCVL